MFPVIVCVVPVVAEVAEIPITDADVDPDVWVLAEEISLTVLFCMVFEPAIVAMPRVLDPDWTPVYALCRLAMVFPEIVVVSVLELYIP